ncbi:MAG: hypothetical protein E7612_04405 [Ruminococcaceae bacterium]|nr:hypothetical protein [Oscillospiraceae bacterium]
MFLIPKPRKMAIAEEKLLAKELKIISDDSKILEFATDNGELPLNFVHEDSMGAEEYSIKATKDGVEVKYGDLELHTEHTRPLNSYGRRLTKTVS